ncbi:murein DD-endopeptidase MepM/ murein hydrolase activator NlpD [Neorhizobium sp. R1-B]|uniref:LysM peptidoglycan-binding domain-containing M23 family metallopeptidase n=1 Tax=unclassified Neorhizobium TaxID=2629175 RepID=UPI000DDB9089|nr:MULTISPECIES: LysM peptidoglycan-binding domain-containing M23 family metallopeptidase [unclassified Neorhizobium]TCV60859.1 murein DD-endopeptidase MepM/ murein hydrolase activator NlpD [Neorhizobium sp. S3-V5DH]TDX73855.1 murein DD-endopeptidase MepM/ murein hydrolase activator NlpD [Neorhizobium sp. R1-B]
MRHKSSPKFGKSVAKFAVAGLLASVATGCSSDATRFSGLFSKSDNITTASIPQRQGGGAYGQAPTPRAELAGGQALPPVPQGDYGSRNTAMNQPYPANSGGYSSPARAASAPVAVQRAELAAPGATPPARDPANRQQALAQPFPSSQASAPKLAAPSAASAKADSLTTGTVKPMSGWSTVNAPKVTLKPGETVATLSKRYGVPEKEILKANGGAVAPGQSVVIPTFGPARNSAKVAAGDIDIQNKAPAPAQQPEQKVAVLPSQARDKTLAEPAKLTPPGGKPMGGTYTVKPGDTLTKIARETGTSVDQLKAANNLSAGGIRVGQTLKVANGAAAPAADPVKTASIPQQPTEKAAASPKPAVAAAPAAAQPATPASAPAAKAPAETASVADVEKKSDVAAAAPQSTGISKYRWPVNGAVVAGYGQNVDGNRNDGIDISVPEGTPIKAAENGVVIYAGNGLKQLGNTVLVRHDDGKVTVYGHAGNINVTRGQKITRGQTLASSGMSGDAKRPQVHFEVRKDATPVNPITFLE